MVDDLSIPELNYRDDVERSDGGWQADGFARVDNFLPEKFSVQLIKFGALKKSPLLDAVAATSVGIVGGEPMLDLDYEEDSRADVDMNIVMTGSGKFVEVQATAEHRPFDDAQLTGLIDLARGGIGQLIDHQKQVIQPR